MSVRITALVLLGLIGIGLIIGVARGTGSGSAPTTDPDRPDQVGDGGPQDGESAMAPTDAAADITSAGSPPPPARPPGSGAAAGGPAARSRGAYDYVLAQGDGPPLPLHTWQGQWLVLAPTSLQMMVDQTRLQSLARLQKQLPEQVQILVVPIEADTFSPVQDGDLPHLMEDTPLPYSAITAVDGPRQHGLFNWLEAESGLVDYQPNVHQLVVISPQGRPVIATPQRLDLDDPDLEQMLRQIVNQR
jgi:hypothetical protein